MRKDKEKCPSTIGFRLDGKDGETLLSRAKTLGVSAHELARHYVLLAVNDSERSSDIEAAMVALQKEVLELRRDVATSSEALLSSAGKVEPDDARAWVDENLRVE